MEVQNTDQQRLLVLLSFEEFVALRAKAEAAGQTLPEYMQINIQRILDA